MSFTCCICTEECNNDEKITFNGDFSHCGHFNCIECFQGWFGTRLNNDTVSSMCCPIGCGEKAHPEWVEEMMSCHGHLKKDTQDDITVANLFGLDVGEQGGLGDANMD